MISIGRLRPIGKETIRSSIRLGWIEISLILLASALAFLGAGAPASAQATAQIPPHSDAVYLPLMSTQPAKPHVDVEPVCELNAEEAAFLSSMQNHPEQGRAAIYCNTILAKAARAKARDMAVRGFFSHTDPDGRGPNQLVTEMGYKLPSYYPKSGTANNIESLAAGYTTPQTVFQGFLNSQYHREHILGTNPFYGGQQQVGIGYYYTEGSTHRYYWVVLSAPTETD